MEKWTPEQLNKQTSRVEVDAKLTKGGAEYVQDVDAETGAPKEPRLHLSEQQISEKNAFNQIIEGFTEDEIKEYFANMEGQTNMNLKNFGRTDIVVTPDGRFELTRQYNEKVPFDNLEDSDKERIIGEFRRQLK